MSFIQEALQFFKKRIETDDNHWDDSLKTHYYKTTKEKGLEAIENLFKHSKQYKIHSISKEHGEISVTHKKIFIIATVVMVRPYYTAIDFTAMDESLISLGLNKKEINNLYQQLDTTLPLAD